MFKVSLLPSFLRKPGVSAHCARPLISLLAACACMPAAAGNGIAVPPPPSAAPVVATLALHGPDALEVSYRIPPFCKALTFRNGGMRPETAALVRKDWAPVDDCTAIDFQSIRPRHAACTTLRVRVPATTRARDRVLYAGVQPWAQPFGDGIYAHTAAYSVNAGCGPVAWQFSAPGGTVMVDGSAAAQAVALPPAAGNAGGDAAGMPALLLAQAYRADAPPFQADGQVDDAVRSLLLKTLEQARHALQAMLPALSFAPGYVLASGAGEPVLRSDAPSPRVLHLLVPAQPPADLAAQARTLLAHELAHLGQPARWNEAWRLDLPAIREGGAEFLRLAASSRLGWLGEAQLKDELEAAVNGCLAAAGERPWHAFAQRNDGDNARRCGLTLHLLGLAPASGKDGALARLQDYYRQGRDGARTDFARALECGADAGCAPHRLPQVLGDQALAEVVRDAARRPDSLLHAQPAWGPALVEVMAFRQLEALMRADCHGGANLARDKAAPRIGPGVRCDVLRTGMVVATAEGLPLFADARAVEASSQACRRRGATTLGLRDGRTVRLRCGPAEGLPAAVFGVDGARAQAMTR